MAETSLRSLVICISFYVCLSSASLSSSQVTFVGFLNDQRAFSALLEVDLAFEVPSRSNWLASTTSDCKDIYGFVSKVDQGQASSKGLWRTLQLMLPVQKPHESSPKLFLCYQDHDEKYVALQAQGFQLPKVTVNEVLNNDYDEKQYILEPINQGNYQPPKKIRVV